MIATILTFSTIFIFSLVGLEQAAGFGFFAGFRQLAILGVFLVVWALRPGKPILGSKYVLAVALMTLVLISGYITHGTPAINIFIGTFMTVEFALIFYIATSSNINLTQLVSFINAFIIFLFANASIAFIKYLPNFPSAMREDVGVQGDAGFFASGLNVGISLLLALNILKNKKYILVVAAFFTLLIFLTSIKKAIIFNLLLWLLWAFNSARYSLRAKLLFILAMVLMFVIISFTGIAENINDNVNYIAAVGWEEHVRLAMYTAAVRIAIDFFPVGSGAGTFGSLASITDYYSDLYYLYDVASLGGNSAEAITLGNNTVLDTYWPHIIAETGFLGLFLTIYLMYFPAKIGAQYLRVKNQDNQLKFFAFIAFSIPCLLMFDGLALYTPESPSFIIFLSGITGFCVRSILKTTR